jgi:hypothetical protein
VVLKRDINEEQELFEDATIVKLDDLERLHDNRGPFQVNSRCIADFTCILLGLTLAAS